VTSSTNSTYLIQEMLSSFYPKTRGELRNFGLSVEVSRHKRSELPLCFCRSYHGIHVQTIHETFGELISFLCESVNSIIGIKSKSTWYVGWLEKFIIHGTMWASFQVKIKIILTRLNLINSTRFLKIWLTQLNLI
jgi:hypothetical protein